MIFDIWKVILVAAVICFVNGHVEEEPGHMSLPKLLLQKTIDDLSLNWEYQGDISLDTGRLIVQNGGIWSIPRLAGTLNEWTIEYTFRSTGTNENDLQYVDRNALSFWLINNFDSKQKNNFNGPESFDGFQFLINGNQESGLKIFNNDGTKKLNGDLHASIGNCGFQFLDSLVPFTIRISYSSSQNWFKVQVDNNLCFKTDRITFPSDNPDFKFGFTASSVSSESWEIFDLNIWSHLTSDAIDDHGLMEDNQVKVEFKTVNPDLELTNAYSPDFNRESLMERNRKFQENLDIQQSDSGVAKKHDNVDALLKQLHSLEAKLDSFAFTDNLEVQGKLEEAQQTISNLQNDFSEFKTNMMNYQTQLLNVIQKLNEKVISEVREHQYDTSELSKKVDLILATHKETSYLYKKQQNSAQEAPGITNIIIKWIFIPVVIGVSILVVFIYKLRHEIKHSKLL